MCQLITMPLMGAMVLMGTINLVTCNELTHVYTDNCEPPFGFILPNDTILYTTPKFPEIYPIERCCPACHECAKVGGYCKIRWLPEIYPEWCDFTCIDECRDYSCTCCIKCADDKCSPCTETGGECRVECRYGEIEDEHNVCSYNKYRYGEDHGEKYCKCCKRCEPTNECIYAFGKCVTSPKACHHGSFASTGCCGGCFCCKPVLEPVIASTCATSGGYCVEEADDCANGYYACFGECSKTLFLAGLKTIELGYCCIPKEKSNPIGRLDQQGLMLNEAFMIDDAFAPQEKHDSRRLHPRDLGVDID